MNQPSTAGRHEVAKPVSDADKPLLVLNAGSSSLKFAVFKASAKPELMVSGTIERMGTAGATYTQKTAAKKATEPEKISAPDQRHGLEYLLKRLGEAVGDGGFAAVGHRVVHGGPRYREPQRVDGAMLAELRRLRGFDPEHLPAEISLMELLAEKFPELPQVACFDTEFHRTMPRVATMLPIPRCYEAQGVQRYGFHGLSYAYLMQELGRVAGADAARGRVILAHLGSGSSLAAVREGRSVDTTMAFTPAAGLMMGTRTGDIDPGLVSFLAQSEQMTAKRFDRMVNHESGLLGVSETSADMRDLLTRESEDVRAAEAVALFCYQVKKGIGAYAAVLGGLDTLVFAGGIGENAAPVRARVCEGLGFLGLELDATANAKHAAVISSATSRVAVRVIRTDEALMIAQAMGPIILK